MGQCVHFNSFKSIYCNCCQLNSSTILWSCDPILLHHINKQTKEHLHHQLFCLTSSRLNRGSSKKSIYWIVTHGITFCLIYYRKSISPETFWNFLTTFAPPNKISSNTHFLCTFSSHERWSSLLFLALTGTTCSRPIW